MVSAIHEGPRRAATKRRAKTLIARSAKEGLAPMIPVKSGSGKTTGSGTYYATIYTASPEDRICMIRQGVLATDAKMIVRDLGVEHQIFYHALGLKTATVNRKAKNKGHLSSDESERLLGVAKLVGQVETIVAESGDAQGFDAPEWVSRWLRAPLPALGGEMPINLLDTMEGQSLVSDALARIQSGAYA